MSHRLDDVHLNVDLRSSARQCSLAQNNEVHVTCAIRQGVPVTFSYISQKYLSVAAPNDIHEFVYHLIFPDFCEFSHSYVSYFGHVSRVSSDPSVCVVP